MPHPILLNPEFLKTLERISLKSRAGFKGTVGAHHLSRTRGQGIEFADYRRYSAGDDARSLDWNAYLRLGKLFLKVHQIEQHIPVRILLDSSQSMDCEGSEESKFIYAKRVTATLAYLALLHLDPVVIAPFAAHMQRPLIVSGNREQFWPVVQFLGGLACDGRTDLLCAVREFVANFVTRGIVVVISDFFDEEGCERAVKMLALAGHDFVLIQLHSAEEQNPSAEGELILEDAETGVQRLVECFSGHSATYQRRFLEFSEQLRRTSLRSGGRYARAATNVPYEEFVLRALRASQVLE